MFVSCAFVLSAFTTFLGIIAGLAINARVIDVADLPADGS
jgi:hypothetical protein